MGSEAVELCLRSRNRNYRGGLATTGLAAALLLCLTSAGANAQIVPGTIEPGRAIEQPDAQPGEPAPSSNIITVPDFTQGPVPGSTDKVFVLNNILIDGLTVYQPSDLLPLYSDLLGQPVSFADLNRIARELSLRYRRDGFVLSRAILPPQQIVGGVVRLQAIEGRVTAIEFSGATVPQGDLVRAMANRILSPGPTRSRDLERYLLLIDDLPGITARSLLQPGNAPGTASLVIFIDTNPFEGSLSLDNRGTRSVGPYRGTLVGATNSLFGRHERTTLRGIITGFVGQTRELRFAEFLHEQQIGSRGIRVRGRAAISHLHPGGRAASSRIEGQSWLAEIRGQYPLVRTRQFNTNLFFGFRALHARTDVLEVRVAKDRVRKFWFLSRVDYTDDIGGVNELDLEITQGAEILYATQDGLGRSRSNGRHEFTRGNFEFTRIQDLSNGFSARISGMGQLAASPLLASEEIGLGGTQFGRGYDGGEISGDDGIAGLIEVRFRQRPTTPYVESYQLYAFYDGGIVWNIDPVVGESRRESLASLGGGLRFNLMGDLSGYMEIGVPLTRPVASRGSKHRNDPRFFFSILGRF